MGNNFKEYIKRFANRNFINESLRNDKGKTHNNLTTLTDFLLLPMLPIMTITIIFQKIFSKKGK